MIKSKKQMFTIIGVFTLVMLLGTVTYAFFNYTRTGSANTIRVGRIAFNSSQSGNINLTNAFPITSTEAETDTTNAKSTSITITGDTDYTNGVEYVLTASDVNLTVNGKLLPISLDITVSGNNNNTLGTLETGDYYANRSSYSVSKYKIEYDGEMEDGSHILVGYIAPNTTSGTIEGINGIINIKAYIDKDRIFISDTYDGTESDNMGTLNSMVGDKVVFTTTEWNSIQSSETPLSFKVKVEANEGIWVREPLSLQQEITRKVSTANYIASYATFIASSSRYSSYTTQDTVGENTNKQTVYYYTGSNAAANSNVLFAGYCWQIIRTTDNGGVRLLYNGVAQNNKCETTRSKAKGLIGQDGMYYDMEAATLFGRSYDYDLETGVFTIKDSAGLPTSWSTSDNNNNGTSDRLELIGTYTCRSSSSTCSTLYYVDDYMYNSDYGLLAEYSIGTVNHLSEIGTSAYNSLGGTFESSGYYHLDKYSLNDNSRSGQYHTNAVWNPTLSKYELSSPDSPTNAPDATHHYICNSNCSRVNYYEYTIAGSNLYITLASGDTIEDTLYKTINYKVNDSDPDALINEHKSIIAEYIDHWYEKNMTLYANYLDKNAVYCNNRSVADLGGWNPNGGSLNDEFLYKNGEYTMDLNCENITDRFSVANKNIAELKYPIGLLTAPESRLMDQSYSIIGHNYWLMSPGEYSNDHNYSTYVGNYGTGHTSVRYEEGVRPLITIKPGTKFKNGTGTYTDPYIIGPIVTKN